MRTQNQRRVTPARRLTRLAMLALVLGSLLPAAPPASAHGGGGAAATIEAGAYLIYAYDGEPGAEPDRIRYTLILRDATTGSPVDGATVRIAGDSTVTAESASTSVGPVTANGVANVYEYTLPDVGEASWQVRATIEAPAGTATTESFTLHGPQAGPASQDRSGQPESAAAVPWWTWTALATVVATAVAGLVVARRRSTPSGPRQ